MRIVPKAQNLREWIAIKANLVPSPAAVIVLGLAAKAIMLASKLHVFEVCQEEPQTVEQIAQRTNLHPRGLGCLLDLLTSLEYLDCKGGEYSLTKVSRKWCLKASPDNLRNQLRFFNEISWRELAYLEEFLETGEGLEIHDSYFTEEQWGWYQLGQLDQARITLRSATRMMPMPGRPTEMLDIGGSHGLYSVELCKKHPTLRATILDLPQAVEKARPIVERSDLGERIGYRKGDALMDGFGENRYDLVLMSNLAHHFSAEENATVSKRAAKALKTGGYFVIQDWLRPQPSSRMDIVAIAVDMYFNLTSTAGTWTLDELKGFQDEAGLAHHRVNRFVEIPSFVQVCARKE